ncbi:MAG TPA: glycosyltransferase [Cyanobacteria bacterium UBA11162]|nr:glycosyltransferase [Cyanobacteria bacterium UBA11162]
MRVIAEPAFKDRYANPYTWLLYTQMTHLGVDIDEFSPLKLLQNKYAIWHRHWPERNLNNSNIAVAIAKTQALLFLMKIARSRGIKTVWTIHNLAAHERRYPHWEAKFWHGFISQLDGCISFSQAGMEAARERFPALKELPNFVISHGHYRAEYPNHISAGEARAELGIPTSAKVLLFFGKIRPYKNVTELIRIFRQLSDPEALLYIVGFPEVSDLKTEIEAEAISDSRIRINLDFIPKDQAQIYFAAADLVILPYREILNSGSALLALSFNRPILVPQRGSLGELQEQVGAEWVRTYTGDINPGHIETALNWVMNTKRSELAPLSVFEWKELARQTIDAYHTIATR